MVIYLFPRPSSPESYALGQNLNFAFGVALVAVLVLGALVWAIDRWRTRRARGKHAALHRVRERAKENGSS